MTLESIEGRVCPPSLPPWAETEPCAAACWIWGLIPHTRVTLQKVAPMGDPIEIRVRGYELTLRVEEAQKIEVEGELK